MRPSSTKKECLVVFEAAPPCQDFFPIGPAGHQGNGGGLFDFSGNFRKAVYAELEGYRTAFSFENMATRAADAIKTVTAVRPGGNFLGVVLGDVAPVSQPRQLGGSHGLAVGFNLAGHR